MSQNAENPPLQERGGSTDISLALRNDPRMSSYSRYRQLPSAVAIGLFCLSSLSNVLLQSSLPGYTIFVTLRSFGKEDSADEIFP